MGYYCRINAAAEQMWELNLDNIQERKYFGNCILLWSCFILMPMYFKCRSLLFVYVGCITDSVIY